MKVVPQATKASRFFGFLSLIAAAIAVHVDKPTMAIIAVLLLLMAFGNTEYLVMKIEGETHES